VAEITRGEYFRAASEKDMERIYQSLSMRIVMQKHQMSEVTALFMLVGMLLVTLGGAQRMRGRVGANGRTNDPVGWKLSEVIAKR
jgi:hypothetical protein